MADAIPVLWALVIGFFLIGWGVLLVTSSSMALNVRRTDPAIIQLRLFRRHDWLANGMLLLGLGTVGGFLASTPWLVIILQSGGTAAPFALSAWTLGWSLLWSVATCWGFLSLSRVFSVQETGQK